MESANEEDKPFGGKIFILLVLKPFNQTLPEVLLVFFRIFWLIFGFGILANFNLAMGASSSNYGILSSDIAEKNLRNFNHPQIFLEGISNFSIAVQRQSHNYSQNFLPDQSSKNHQKNQLNFGNDTQLFLKMGLKNRAKNPSVNSSENQQKSSQKYNFSGEDSSEESLAKLPQQKADILGLIAKIEFNYNSRSQNEAPNLDQSFLFAENSWGRVEFGNYFAVNQKMKFGPAQIARGAGGINGKYLEQVNFPSLGVGGDSNSLCIGKFGDANCRNIKMPRFITLAQSPIGHGGYAKSFYRRGSENNYKIGDFDYLAQRRSNFRSIKDDSYDGIEDATKLSYYSPRVAGLQTGLSYAFDSKSQGATKQTALDVDYLSLRDIFSFGANYLKNFDNLEVKIAATAEHGKAHNSGLEVRRRNLNSYDFSTILSYFGFSISGSYGSWGKSLMPKNGIYGCDYDSRFSLSAQNCANSGTRLNSANYFTYGLAYEFGPAAASLTAINSQFMENRYRAISFGIDYRLLRNLTAYFEATNYSFLVNQPAAVDVVDQNSLKNSSRQIANNFGNVLLTGFYLTF